MLETIHNCNINNKNGTVVADNMAKAFHTQLYGFLREVFSFFNVGHNMTL
jgi:hypothetical protein